jgi:hypothetical protein
MQGASLRDRLQQVRLQVFQRARHRRPRDPSVRGRLATRMRSFRSPDPLRLHRQCDKSVAARLPAKWLLCIRIALGLYPPVSVRPEPWPSETSNNATHVSLRRARRDHSRAAHANSLVGSGSNSLPALPTLRRLQCWVRRDRAIGKFLDRYVCVFDESSAHWALTLKLGVGSNVSTPLGASFSRVLSRSSDLIEGPYLVPVPDLAIRLFLPLSGELAIATHPQHSRTKHVRSCVHQLT